jgi:hypothetical protein
MLSTIGDQEVERTVDVWARVAAGNGSNGPARLT